MSAVCGGRAERLDKPDFYLGSVSTRSPGVQALRVKSTSVGRDRRLLQLGVGRAH